MNLDECEAIFDKALASNTEAEFCYAIEPLFKEYEILSLEFGRGSIFWRARLILDAPYTNLSEMDYPPAEYARVGRLNDLGKPCFYISARKETALAEVEAKEGERVQLAGFRILNDAPIRLAVIGEYSNVQKSGYMHFAGQDPDMTISKILNSMPRHDGLKKIYIDKFFAHVLADQDAANNGYRFSRALAQAIYAVNASSGIVFPSVKDRGGFNIGVKAAASDRLFHNVCCFVAEIGKSRKFGVQDYEIVSSVERLDANNNFIWSASEVPGVIGMYGMSKDEYDIAIRNPSDRNNLLHMLHSDRKPRSF